MHGREPGVGTVHETADLGTENAGADAVPLVAERIGVDAGDVGEPVGLGQLPGGEAAPRGDDDGVEGTDVRPQPERLGGGDGAVGDVPRLM